MVKILKGKVVRVVPNGETSFDRIVATCYIDGDKDIGAELISRGLARDIPAFTDGKYKEFETGAGRRRVKPTPYNNNAKKHPLAQPEEPKPHPVEVVEIKPLKEPKAEPADEEISLVEKWDDVEITIKPNVWNNPIPRFSRTNSRSAARKEASKKPKIYSAPDEQAVQ